MHPRNRLFILAALIYSLLGGLVGLLWLAHPGLIPGNVPRIHGHLIPPWPSIAGWTVTTYSACVVPIDQVL
ncbi:hypothetical protein [Thioalkalivibrio sulfidiphilus]|uniref:hypothetical protein n=1 Tax=Thioalkalivibrio sulfidiphilus TaxID=1033854 RepID=UPI000380CDC3|nr:hypothetical protein [Thioalkalivibrio sulfidiphilus]